MLSLIPNPSATDPVVALPPRRLFPATAPCVALPPHVPVGRRRRSTSSVHGVVHLGNCSCVALPSHIPVGRMQSSPGGRRELRPSPSGRGWPEGPGEGGCGGSGYLLSAQVSFFEHLPCFFMPIQTPYICNEWLSMINPAFSATRRWRSSIAGSLNSNNLPHSTHTM